MLEVPRRWGSDYSRYGRSCRTCRSYDPSLFLWYGKDTISLGLGIIMLGMGLTLSVEDFAQVLKKPKLIGLGAFLQFSIMPAWAALIAFVFKIPGEMAVGLILAASCPGGTASNVVVFLANGKVALSVCLDSFFHITRDCGYSVVIYMLSIIWWTPWVCTKSIFYISLDPSAFWNQSEKSLTRSLPERPPMASPC